MAYDTDTAESVKSYSPPGYSAADHSNYEETLYRTKRGRWFLAGTGGGNTRYRKREGQNAWTYGSGIVPLTPPEAREWCESHGVMACTIEAWFEVEEA